MEKLDLNGNGTIEYSEFLIASMDPQKIVREDRLREVFDMFDVDKSGAITVDEIKKILGGGGGGAGANLHLKPADTLKSQIT
jgi:calcium-dependent protein kinase